MPKILCEVGEVGVVQQVGKAIAGPTVQNEEGWKKGKRRKLVNEPPPPPPNRYKALE
jgi:hypothetical protein